MLAPHYLRLLAPFTAVKRKTSDSKKPQKLSPGGNLSRKFRGISPWHSLCQCFCFHASLIATSIRCCWAASSLPSPTLHRELIHSLWSPCCCSGDSRKGAATSLITTCAKQRAQSLCRFNSTPNSTALL